MHINNRPIANGEPPFIVAEIGINHNGSVEIAKALILAAQRAGADAVKFQKRTVEVVYSSTELLKPRMIPPENGILKHAVERGVLSTEAVERLTFSGFTNTTNGDLKRALEFTEEEYRAIADYALAHSLVFFASPWDVASVTFLERLAVPCHKVASACLTDEALLRALRDTKKPILLSTGMSTFQEIARAVSILGKDNLALLHTVSTYPTENSHLNLLVMQTLAAEFWGVPIGYSGHEKGILPSIIASALGAAVIERHITLDKRMWGSDQPASLEPREFAEMVEGIREARIVLGDGIKRVLPQEEAVRDKLRRVHFEW